jgi:hypothetical protein
MWVEAVPRQSGPDRRDRLAESVLAPLAAMVADWPAGS